MRDKIAGMGQPNKLVDAVSLVPALPLPEQPVTALVKDADLAACRQDQQDLRQPVGGALAGGQLGDQRPQQPGVEPVEGAPVLKTRMPPASR